MGNWADIENKRGSWSPPSGGGARARSRHYGNGTALEGILRSAAATVVLLLLSLSVAVLFGLVNGRRDDNGAS